MSRSLFLASLTASVALASAVADEPTLRLALELLQLKEPAAAAVEFRRLSLASPEFDKRASYAWMSAFAWWRAGDAEKAEAALDYAEDEQALRGPEISLLRGELALARRAYAEAAFFFDQAQRNAEHADEMAYAEARRMVALLRAGDRARAQAAVEALNPESREALLNYLKGRDKSPRLGGWLGILPGAGYAYAGEYPNAARSLILNGLFMWGMMQTAERELWGAFAVITFFEITWYSGSIYGGIDASHRYNQRRLAETEKKLMTGFLFEPDYTALPSLQIRYRF